MPTILTQLTLIENENGVKSVALPLVGNDTDGYSFPHYSMGSQIVGPTLMATIPYSDLTASTTYSANLTGVLSRNATLRTFVATNTMNQGETWTLTPFENTTSLGTPSGISGTNTSADIGTLPNNSLKGMSVASSMEWAQLGANVDSVQLSIGVGSTAPTEGEIQIYVTEVLGG